MKTIIYYLVFFTITSSVPTGEYDVFGREVKEVVTHEYKRKMTKQQLEQARKVDAEDNSVLITRVDTIEGYTTFSDTLYIK